MSIRLGFARLREQLLNALLRILGGIDMADGGGEFVAQFLRPLDQTVPFLPAESVPLSVQGLRVGGRSGRGTPMAVVLPFQITEPH